MKRDELIAEVNEVFATVQRPEHFTDYQHCCECAEHDATLCAHTPDTITREALSHGGWDPMTLATNVGFCYYLPALIRMALTQEGEEYYVDQFLFQVIWDGARNSRWQSCTVAQRAVVAKTLHVLMEERLEEIENNLDGDNLMRAIEIWTDNG